jgi:hypothetical protein
VERTSQTSGTVLSLAVEEVPGAGVSNQANLFSFLFFERFWTVTQWGTVFIIDGADIPGVLI